MSGKELMIGDKPLSSLRVVDLKEELEKRGLSKSGSKKDLAERLRAKVQLEISQQQGAAADGEELPNISMQEKLAEQNPFIRDYFASQAELFHSQKLAKQLIEDERRRESEASAPSADEGGESSAAEDKGVDSSIEFSGGKVKKLAKRFETQTTEKENSEPTKNIEETSEKVSTEEPAVKSAILEQKPVDDKMSIDDLDKKPSDSKDKEPKSNATSPSSSRSRSRSATPKIETAVPEVKKINNRNEGNESEPETSSSSEDEAEEKHVKNKQVEKAEVIQNNGVGNVKKLAEQFETQTKEVADKVETVEKPTEPAEIVSVVEKKNESNNEDMMESDASRPSSKLVSRSPSRVISSKQAQDLQPERRSNPEKSIKSPEKSIKSPEKSIKTLEKSIKSPEKSSESPEKSSESPEKSTKSPEKSIKTPEKSIQSPEKSIKTPEKSTKSPEKSIKSPEKSTKTPEKSIKSPEKSTKTPEKSIKSPEKIMTSPAIEAKEGKVRKLTEKFEKSKSKEDLDETEKVEPQEEVSMMETVVEKTSAEPPKRKLILAPEPSESKSRPEVRKQRQVSTRNEEMQDDEALDYGEEEKIKAEPAKFDWTRRILRLKNKHDLKEHGKKWQREVDSKVTENINTEYLNQWFPAIKLVSAADLRLEEKDKSPPTEDKVEIIRKFSIESDSSAIPKMENITVTRKVSLIPMITSQMDDTDKDLPPARHPPSELILITNLVRPFTLPQLKELLQRTGNLEELWVDKIKSKCIAKYEKEEEAFETRAALHGVNWPQSNPKALHVDYTTQDRMNDYKSRESGDQKPSLTEKPVTAESMPVREWDVGKRAKSRSPNRLKRRSRSVSRDRKRLRRSPSPHRRRGSRSPHPDRRSRGDVKEPEPLGKALDELFRKTTATPSIYWLPLTPQQIAEKEELRRKRMVERERRLAEMNKIRPPR